MMIACIDIGGTSLKVAIANDKAELFDQDILPVKDNFDGFMDVIVNWIEEKKETYNIDGVAFSAPGAVDTVSGIIGGASAIPYIHGPNFKQIMKEKLGLPCSIENDANCAALAEVWKGAASDVNDCCFIVSGSSIGGAVIKDKCIHKGKHIHGGEFGYMIAQFDYDTYEMNTWSWVGSTLWAVRNAAKELGVDYTSLDGKEVFDHYNDNPAYFKAVDKYYWAGYRYI